MKRIALLLMILMLAVPAAHAEHTAGAEDTRQEIIMLEGMEERITTWYFESPHGWYSIWIDPEILAPLPMEEGDDRDIFLPPGDDGDSAFQLMVMYREGCTEEQAVADERVEINDAFGTCEEIGIEPYGGHPVFGGCAYRALRAQSGDQSTTHFVLPSADGVYIIALQYPSEAAEGFATRVETMLRSFTANNPLLPARD